MFKIEAGMVCCGMLGGQSNFLYREFKVGLKKKKKKIPELKLNPSKAV